MKKMTLLAVSMLMLWMSSCKKNDDPSPNNTPAKPYYFKFTLNGTSYNFNENFPQYMPFYENEVGGYQVANTSLFPSAGLRLSWPVADTVKESDVMALVGKTIYFDDPVIHPELSYEADYTSDIWYSVDTADAAFNVKITNVVFLKNDTSFNPLRTYVITGTCSAVMSNGTNTSVLTGGQFNFIVSRRDL